MEIQYNIECQLFNPIVMQSHKTKRGLSDLNLIRLFSSPAFWLCNYFTRQSCKTQL